ncbi:hypothetical protein Esti_004977 [Eimeria stiedai]
MICASAFHTVLASDCTSSPRPHSLAGFHSVAAFDFVLPFGSWRPFTTVPAFTPVLAVASAPTHCLQSGHGPACTRISNNGGEGGKHKGSHAQREAVREQPKRQEYVSFSLVFWYILLRSLVPEGQGFWSAKGLRSPLVRAMVHGVHVALKTKREESDLRERCFWLARAIEKHF